jgi:hypothetical protein
MLLIELKNLFFFLNFTFLKGKKKVTKDIGKWKERFLKSTTYKKGGEHFNTPEAWSITKSTDIELRT